MSLRDNTERHLFYKDIYKHRGYAYILSKLCGRCVVDTLGIDHTIKHYPTIRCTLLWSCGRNFLKTKTTVVWRTAPKIGCTSEVQKKIRIFFCTSLGLHYLCTQKQKRKKYEERNRNN